MNQMKDEIKEILAYFEEYVKITDMHDSEPMLNWKDLKIVLDYITNLQEENEKLKILNKTAEIYIRKHTIFYIEDGIECVKPSEYFNMLWPVEILNGDTEGIEELVEQAQEDLKGEENENSISNN